MDDLISRQALIDAFEEEFYSMYSDDYNYMIKFFNNLPSAEPKKGKWLVQFNGWGDVYYECSWCKAAITLIEGTPTDNLYYYCPVCGARMEE